MLARHPRHARAWHAKAVVHLLYGELAEARAAAEKAAEHEKKKSATRSGSGAHLDVTLGVIRARAGDLAGAALAFESATRRDASLAVAHYDLGLVRARMDDPEAAKEAFAAALEKARWVLQSRVRARVCARRRRGAHRTRNAGSRLRSRRGAGRWTRISTWAFCTRARVT